MDDLKVRYCVILAYVTYKTNLDDISPTLYTHMFEYLEYHTLQPITDVLSYPKITTATAAYDSNISFAYKVMAKWVQPDENRNILAVKNNTDSYESCAKNRYSGAIKIKSRRTKHSMQHPDMPTKSARHSSGNGLYFNSSIELVIGTDVKQYNIRISPSRGSIQVLGLDSPIFDNAQKCINTVLQYIKDSLDLDTLNIVYNRRLTIVNCKTELIAKKENHCIPVDVLTDIFNNIRIGKEKNKEILDILPYEILHSTTVEMVGSFIMIKFHTPIPSNPNRITTSKIFISRKINILGTAHTVTAIKIFNFLNFVFKVYYSSILRVREIGRKKIKKLDNDWTVKLKSTSLAAHK